MKSETVSGSSLSMEHLQKPKHQWRRWVFGSPLKNTENCHEKVGLWGGLTLLGSDALSSVAYASEEILLALSVLGPSFFFLSLPISLGIIAVMCIVILSYRQTVAAYPHGGGAYTVTRHEIGKKTSLLSAASLLLDYMLTVAVSVAAGVRALVSLYPELMPYSLNISLAMVLFLGWLNLRGIKDSARILLLPFIVFLGTLSTLIIMGWINRPILPDTSFHSVSPDPWVSGALIFVALRAFAGGCTAMTGIEAVANAVSIFKKPCVSHAQNLYTLLAFFLGTFFFGISFLAHTYSITPSESESLISLLGRIIFGEGIAHHILQIITATVLFLAANTAFADYPRLCGLLAKDGYLPKQLAQIGDRLVFHKGIILLMILSMALLIIFQASVHRLIPLYALGVMTAFTLSQFGMAKHWRRQEKWGKSFLNGIGACVTLIVFCIVLEAKFFEGAFLFLFIIPFFIVIFENIRTHYADVEKQLRIPLEQKEHHRAFSNLHGRRVLVPISRMHLGSLEALAFAREMTKDVHAILVDIDPTLTNLTRHHIESLGWDIQIIVLESPYRSIIKPLINYVSNIKQDTVLIFPEIIPNKGWHKYLHNETVIQIIRTLEQQILHPGSTRVIITVPYHLKT